MGTCYELTSEGVSSMGVRGDMTTQAAALAEMAERSTIDPATVARAQEALERDIAWLEQYKTGNQTGDPERIDASPAEVEAARVLVELLLERR
jgi:hypothetical protein